jgi:hypothetical protein
MSSELASLFETRTPDEIVTELSIRIYEPPLSELRDRLADLPAAIRVPMLVLDFDTEVSMQGILGFLENSTGLFLNQTIDAFSEIGAMQTAATLTDVRTIMERHGVTPADLRADFEGTTEYQITSFQELHGDERSAMASEVDDAAGALYLYQDNAEDVWGLLGAFVATRKEKFIGAIRGAM